MRLRQSLSLLALAPIFASAAGCIVSPEPEPVVVQTAPPSGAVVAPVAPADSAVPLGAQQELGYHVSAGAASELPSGDIGYVVTANGQGGYRLTWSDTLGSAAHFSGTITCDTTFDASQLRGYSGNEAITLSADARVITFDSVPGANLDGVDLVSQSDPIYVDLLVDGVHTGFSVYFTGAQSSLLLTSAYDPVAFTSP